MKEVTVDNFDEAPGEPEFCPNCGSELSDDEEGCAACGATLDDFDNVLKAFAAYLPPEPAPGPHASTAPEYVNARFTAATGSSEWCKCGHLLRDHSTKPGSFGACTAGLEDGGCPCKYPDARPDIPAFEPAPGPHASTTQPVECAVNFATGEFRELPDPHAVAVAARKVYTAEEAFGDGGLCDVPAFDLHDPLAAAQAAGMGAVEKALEPAPGSTCRFCARLYEEHADAPDPRFTIKTPCLGLKANFLPAPREFLPPSPETMAGYLESEAIRFRDERDEARRQRDELAAEVERLRAEALELRLNAQHDEEETADLLEQRDELAESLMRANALLRLVLGRSKGKWYVAADILSGTEVPAGEVITGIEAALRKTGRLP